MPQRPKEHPVRRVLDYTTHGSHSTGNLTDFWIERVHDHTDLWEPIPDDRGDRQTVGSGKDLVDHENLRKKLPAELDALPTVLCDSHALHIRFRVDQVAEVLANRRVVLGDEHSDLCHAEHSRSDQALGKVPFGHV